MKDRERKERERKEFEEGMHRARKEYEDSIKNDEGMRRLQRNKFVEEQYQKEWSIETIFVIHKDDPKTIRKKMKEVITQRKEDYEDFFGKPWDDITTKEKNKIRWYIEIHKRVMQNFDIVVSTDAVDAANFTSKFTGGQNLGRSVSQTRGELGMSQDDLSYNTYSPLPDGPLDKLLRTGNAKNNLSKQIDRLRSDINLDIDASLTVEDKMRNLRSDLGLPSDFK